MLYLMCLSLVFLNFKKHFHLFTLSLSVHVCTCAQALALGGGGVLRRQPVGVGLLLPSSGSWRIRGRFSSLTGSAFPCWDISLALQVDAKLLRVEVVLYTHEWPAQSLSTWTMSSTCSNEAHWVFAGSSKARPGVTMPVCYSGSPVLSSLPCYVL